MVIQVTVRLHSVHAQLALDGRFGKDVHTVTLIQYIVGNMLNDSGSLFIVDKGSSLDDEFFRVILELIEYGRLNTLKCDNCLRVRAVYITNLHQVIIPVVTW
jgi:hypothetical protein